MKFVYIGYGDDSPESINFMGTTHFDLNGDAVEVNDERIVNKLMNHRCFLPEDEFLKSQMLKVIEEKKHNSIFGRFKRYIKGK